MEQVVRLFVLKALGMDQLRSLKFPTHRGHRRVVAPVGLGLIATTAGRRYLKVRITIALREA